MAYNLRPAVNYKYPIFSRFCRKLALTKIQQSIDKASEHNRHKVFLRDFVEQEWCQLHLIIYHLYSLHLLKICTNFLFLPWPLSPTECATTDILHPHHRQSNPPLGSGVYDCIAPDLQTRLIRQWQRTLLLPKSPETTAPLGTHLSSSRCYLR